MKITVRKLRQSILTRIRVPANWHLKSSIPIMGSSSFNLFQESFALSNTVFLSGWFRRYYQNHFRFFLESLQIYPTRVSLFYEFHPVCICLHLICFSMTFQLQATLPLCIPNLNNMQVLLDFDHNGARLFKMNFVSVAKQDILGECCPILRPFLLSNYCSC